MSERESLWKFLPRRVDPLVHRVVKFLPTSPPERGDFVLVDGVRSRVTRCKVAWDGPRWTILSLRAKGEASAACKAYCLICDAPARPTQRYCDACCAEIAGKARRQQIRHTHAAGFRSGEWATILTTAPAPDGTDCYVVRFADGVTDYWRVTDEAEPYEFREVAA